MSIGLHRRLRAQASRYWATTPAEFDSLAAAGQILLADVLDLVRLLCRDPVTGYATLQYVFPAAIERANQRALEQKRASNMTRILAMVRPKDDDEAVRLEALKVEAKRMEVNR